jgi:hypothetical protein
MSTATVQAFAFHADDAQPRVMSHAGDIERQFDLRLDLMDATMLQSLQ